MKTLNMMIKRNTKMFFKDKGIFFTSLITPLILLVLYVTFLGNVYRDSVKQVIETTGSTASSELINACVGGQLFASLLAVCCVTVAFCANMLMVQDKVTGSRKDLSVSPVKDSTLAFSYYISSFLSTLIVALTAVAACLIYLLIIGWYMSFADVVLILLDVILLVGFGTALSSIINSFLSSQGQISAVGSIVSSVYGFICGAYMPISQFGKGLQIVLSFLPGTYATCLLKNHAIRGSFNAMLEQGVSELTVTELKKMMDCNLYFFDNLVPIWAMYLILGLSVAILLATYVGMQMIKRKKK
ncbi:MAG: ABC transporter permease [Clostridia bacterium]|nr:ABC transporter permease [Clostridia bacterium]